MITAGTATTATVAIRGTSSDGSPNLDFYDITTA
jgi:hypothetical protein